MKKTTCLVACAVFAAVTAYGEEVFRDSFATLENWKPIQGAGGIESALPGVDHAPYLKLGNNLIVKSIELAPPFIFKAKVLHSAYQRGMMIVFLDGKLHQGFGLLWDSGTESGYNGEGSVILYDINLDAPLTQWAMLPGKNKRLKAAGSGHPATAIPFADLEIAVGADRAVTVKMDGKTLFTESLPSDAAVGNIVLRGNTYSYIDEIVIEK